MPSGSLNGFGTLLLSCSVFPAYNAVRRVAAGDLAAAIGVDTEAIQLAIAAKKSNIVVTNWIEMTKEDFKSFSDENN